MPNAASGPSWAALLLFGVLSRLLAVAFGGLAGLGLPPWPWPAQSAMPGKFLDAFYCWDSTYYLQIAQSGYNYAPVTVEDGALAGGGTAAFLPALPLGMRAAASCGMDIKIAGVLIPNLAFAVGLAFFGRYCALLGRDAATVWRSCILLAAYPTAFFFSCPYQESLGFAAMSIALWAWRSQRPGLAAAGTFLGALARLTALAFPAALALEWLLQKLSRRSTRPLSQIALIALAAALGVGSFMAFLQWRFGHPLAHFDAHRMWGRRPPSIVNLGPAIEELGWVTGPSLVLFVGLGLRAWVVRGPFAAALILAPPLQALSTGTPMSLERVVLASFPAFLDLAELLKNRWAFRMTVAAFLVGQYCLFNGFVHWQFVG